MKVYLFTQYSFTNYAHRPSHVLSISCFTNTSPTTTTTLSLHDALPICPPWRPPPTPAARARSGNRPESRATSDRKSIRLNSSHVAISYAVFFLNKKRCTLRVNYNDTRKFESSI